MRNARVVLQGGWRLQWTRVSWHGGLKDACSSIRKTKWSIELLELQVTYDISVNHSRDGEKKS